MTLMRDLLAKAKSPKIMSVWCLQISTYRISIQFLMALVQWCSGYVSFLIGRSGCRKNGPYSPSNLGELPVGVLGRNLGKPYARSP